MSSTSYQTFWNFATPIPAFTGYISYASETSNNPTLDKVLDEDCAICTEPFKRAPNTAQPIMVETCGHHFHHHCLEK
jgi:hypothetical protein